MYYNDIKITIEEAFEPSVGLINRALIVTHELEVPFMKLRGTSPISDLRTELIRLATLGNLTLGGLTIPLPTILNQVNLACPLLEEAIVLLTSQSDSSGNAIVPDYLYVCGSLIVDYQNATDVSGLTSIIAANTTVESDFWGIIPVQYNTKLVEWLVTFCSSKSKAFFVDIEYKHFTITDLLKSNRGYMIYNGRTNDQSDQQFAAGVYGRCFSGENLVGVKWKTVTGISSYKQATLSDSEVSTLATNGVNAYLYRYGKGSIDGSFTTDSDGNLKAVNHIDEMYIRDNIKYNLIKNIYLWLNSSEMASMSDYAELESVVTSVLSTFADDGFIATIEGLKQFSVNVPIPTSSNRNERLLEGTFKYIPNGAAEWVTITGQEVFDIINGEEV